MHVNVARCDQGQTGLLAEVDEARELLAVVRTGEQFHRDPRAVGKAVREPAGVRELSSRREEGREKGEGTSNARQPGMPSARSSCVS